MHGMGIGRRRAGELRTRADLHPGVSAMADDELFRDLSQDESREAHAENGGPPQVCERADRDDPMLRMGRGDALARGGRTEDALAEYLWCFDHGPEHAPAF